MSRTLRIAHTHARSSSRHLRALALALGLGALAVAGCGSDGDAACGGDLTGQWSFTSATIEGAGDGCTPTGGGISGFLIFNANGRYTLNAMISAWKRTGDACESSTADGGFYTASGGSVCIAGTEGELAGASCDGAVPTLPVGLRGAAQYCVEGDTLTLTTNTMLGLRFPAKLTLERQ
ncbi:hypothetical protein L6R52_31895 [Myxococcota bacterium]|nr:hypothetical protein [Myxococcota bacterium]